MLGPTIPWTFKISYLRERVHRTGKQRGLGWGVMQSKATSLIGRQARAKDIDMSRRDDLALVRAGGALVL